MQPPPDSAADRVLGEAEHTVRLAQQQQLTAAALAELARPGLAWVQPDPTDPIHLVAKDGVLRGITWSTTIAVIDGQPCPTDWMVSRSLLDSWGPYGTLLVAAEALAR
jgi:hypothetical protein